jgi:hypothetical protein
MKVKKCGTKGGEGESFQGTFVIQVSNKLAIESQKNCIRDL